MATIYYWKMKLWEGSVGHISIQFHGLGRYISHWPKRRKLFKGKGLSPNLTLEDDVKAEGRAPDYSLTLSRLMLDEDKCLKWWEDFANSSNNYNLLTRNCANIVRDALLQGLFFTEAFMEEHREKMKAGVSRSSKRKVALLPVSVLNAVHYLSVTAVELHFRQLTQEIEILKAGVVLSPDPIAPSKFTIRKSGACAFHKLPIDCTVERTNGNICDGSSRNNEMKQSFRWRDGDLEFLTETIWDGKTKPRCLVTVIESKTTLGKKGAVVNSPQVIVTETVNVIEVLDPLWEHVCEHHYGGLLSKLLSTIDFYSELFSDGKCESAEHENLNQAVWLKLFTPFLIFYLSSFYNDELSMTDPRIYEGVRKAVCVFSSLVPYFERSISNCFK